MLLETHDKGRLVIGIILIDVVALVILLFCSGFFSSAEVAYFSLGPLRIKRLAETQPEAAQRISDAMKVPTRLLSTVLIGNTLVNICASVVGYSLVDAFDTVYAEEISVLMMTFLLLIFGEIGPKRVAILHPQKLAVMYSRPLLVLVKVTAPLRIVLQKITSSMERTFDPRGHVLTEDEFRTLVDLSEEEGILDEEERTMVRGIIRLEDIKASDVMTPRVDIIGLDLNDLGDDAEDVIRRSNVPRVVLYRDQLDDIDGFLDVRNYLLDPDRQLQKAWIAPMFVPESAPLDKLLSQFQKSGRRMAIVVDEYGGTAGLITRGDILEEITGEIGEEHRRQGPLVEELSENRWLVDGQISLEELNERFGLHLDAEGVDRLAGWISVELERLPHPGDVVKAQGCRAMVRQMRRHRITLVVLDKLQEESK